MKKIIFLSIITTFLINPLYSMNLTNRDCNEIASELNSSMGGMQLDQLTIFQSAICPSGANLSYSYKITTDTSPVTFKKLIPEMKANNITMWCSNPDLIVLIKVLDSVEFRYQNNNNLYLGKYRIDKSYCD